MTDNRSFTVHFHRTDGHRERMRFGDCMLSVALDTIQHVLSVAEGLYIKAELFEDDRLVKTVEQTSPEQRSSARMVSVLVH